MPLQNTVVQSSLTILAIIISDMFATLILAIDHWIQYGEFGVTFMRPFYTRIFHYLLQSSKRSLILCTDLLAALLDAIDETVPVSHRYNRLLACLSPWATYVPGTQMLQLFEEMRRAPIVRKWDVERRGMKPLCNVQGVPEKMLLLSPGLLRRQICLPGRVADFYVLLGIPLKMEEQMIHQYGFLRSVPQHGLTWTAMLEEMVVVWY